MEVTQSQNLIKPEIKSIAISCNTFLRPEILEKTLNSIAKLHIPDGIEIKVLVVDNDADASAQAVVKQIQTDFPFEITYKVEEKRGLASARNRLLKEAINLGVSHIAILDDDDVADAEWLYNLVDLYNTQENAFIISGPEYCCFDGDFPDYLTNNNIFVKKTTKKKGEIRKVCSTHNAFFPLSIVKDNDIWFDSSFVLPDYVLCLHRRAVDAVCPVAFACFHRVHDGFGRRFQARRCGSRLSELCEFVWQQL